jgi:hypothetical protein
MIAQRETKVKPGYIAGCGAEKKVMIQMALRSALTLIIDV